MLKEIRRDLESVDQLVRREALRALVESKDITDTVKKIVLREVIEGDKDHEVSDVAHKFFKLMFQGEEPSPPPKPSSEQEKFYLPPEVSQAAHSDPHPPESKVPVFPTEAAQNDQPESTVADTPGPESQRETSVFDGDDSQVVSLSELELSGDTNDPAISPSLEDPCGLKPLQLQTNIESFSRLLNADQDCAGSALTLTAKSLLICSMRKQLGKIIGIINSSETLLKDFPVHVRKLSLCFKLSRSSSDPLKCREILENFPAREEILTLNSEELLGQDSSHLLATLEWFTGGVKASPECMVKIIQLLDEDPGKPGWEHNASRLAEQMTAVEEFLAGCRISVDAFLNNLKHSGSEHAR
ncbi:MAG: hypothetical protein PHQ23_00780 [Candidatus Wallbacteria bacterium]|nr:hypothetical protein [Candidatus Wallbacteria bacterium]